MKKMIVCDLDGTLIRRDRKTAHPEACRAICRLIDKGWTFVPATGRSLCLVPIQALPPFQYIITSNGAAVTDIQAGRQIHSSCLPVEGARAAWEIIQDYHGFVEFFVKNEIILSRRLYNRIETCNIPRFHREYLKGHPPILVDSLGEYIAGTPDCIEKVNMPRLRPEARHKFVEQMTVTGYFNVFPSHERNIEATCRGTSKCSAVRFLSEYLEIPLGDVVAFGDDGNDLEMLQAVGCGVAIGSGHASIVSQAPCATPANVRDGIGWFLKKTFPNSSCL